MLKRLSLLSIFIFVTVASLIGMLLGGLFGLISASIAPDFFRHMIAWKDVEPAGAAIVMGAFGGVICGGALGVFAILVKIVSEWPKKNGEKDT